MVLLERILIVAEGGTRLCQLISAAECILGQSHSHVTLLCLRRAAWPEPVATDPQDCLRTLETFADRLRQAGASGTQVLLREGNPVHVIEQTAQEQSSSLIVLAEERDTAGAGPWFGTTAQRLFRQTAIPVLVVPQDCPPSLQPILCMVDFTDSSRVALTNAVNLARAFDCPISILHAVPEPPPFPVVEGPLWMHERSQPSPGSQSGPKASALDPLCEEERSAHLARAHEDLEILLAGYDLSKVNYEIIVRIGSAVAHAMSLTRERRFGLILAGSSQRSGFIQFTSLSVVDTLTAESEVPVMVFQSPSLFASPSLDTFGSELTVKK